MMCGTLGVCLHLAAEGLLQVPTARLWQCLLLPPGDGYMVYSKSIAHLFEGLRYSVKNVACHMVGILRHGAVLCTLCLRHNGASPSCHSMACVSLKQSLRGQRQVMVTRLTVVPVLHGICLPARVGGCSWLGLPCAKARTSMDHVCVQNSVDCLILYISLSKFESSL
jgi:hypothetical protein